MKALHSLLPVMSAILVPVTLFATLSFAVSGSASTTPAAATSPIPPGPNTQASVDLDGYVQSDYGGLRRGASGWFEIDYDIFNDNFEILVTDHRDGGPTCEIYVANQAGVFTTEYAEECDAATFVQSLDLLYGDIVEITAIIPWLEGGGIVGDPGDDGDNSPGIDPGYGKEDNDSQDCGWGTCALDATFVLGAAVALGVTFKSAPLAIGICAVGGFAVGMKCAEGHADASCKDDLALDFLALFAQVMGIEDIQQFVDVESFIESMRAMMQSTYHVAELHGVGGMNGFELTYGGRDAIVLSDMLIALP